MTVLFRQKDWDIVWSGCEGWLGYVLCIFAKLILLTLNSMREHWQMERFPPFADVNIVVANNKNLIDLPLIWMSVSMLGEQPEVFITKYPMDCVFPKMIFILICDTCNSISRKYDADYCTINSGNIELEVIKNNIWRQNIDGEKWLDV